MSKFEVVVLLATIVLGSAAGSAFGAWVGLWLARRGGDDDD